MAGQRGYIPISTNLVPPPSVAEHWKTYCAGAREAGRPIPERALWRVSRSIIVGRTQQEAWDLARSSAFAGSFVYLITLLKSAKMLSLVKHEPDVPDEAVTPEYAMQHLCIIGDVDGCIRQLQDLWETTGGFGTLLMIAHDWDDREQWRRSMQLLAEKVVPALPSL